MFCGKCGAQLNDGVKFCNKCGFAMSGTKAQAQTVTMRSKGGATTGTKKKNFLLPVLGVIIVAVIVVCVLLLNKPTIYGTWVTSTGDASFTFLEDGTLRLSGKNNILGANLLQFTDDGEGNLVLQLSNGGLSMDAQYEISKDMLLLTIKGKSFTLYPGDKAGTNQEESGKSENLADNLADKVEDALDVFQSISLYGTWADSSGIVAITINKDGTVRIAGLKDVIGVEAFTYTEVDNDTLQLKAASDNPLLNLVSLNIDYEISGEVMTVEIAGKTYKLTKQE